MKQTGSIFLAILYLAYLIISTLQFYSISLIHNLLEIKTASTPPCQRSRPFPCQNPPNPSACPIVPPHRFNHIFPGQNYSFPRKRAILYTSALDSIIHIFQMMNQYELRESSVRRSHVFQNFNPGRSFISTAIVNDSVAYADDLRKSRIQNLPNYKKNNLGQNVNFIVVFQTIEIQRLSNEIQLLRVKFKQAERQLFNAQNYQVQIRQLTEKCYNYENQLEEFREEYEKLNKICQTLYHENETLKNQLNQMDFSLKQKYESERQKNTELLNQIQKWKTRYQASEKSKSKELEELRNLMQSQRKSMIDREIREMTIRFQNERSSLESQIRKCREMLNNRNSQIEDYKQKCQKYEIEIMELRNYEHIIAEHEDKLVLLSNELMRLTELLRNREDEIQAYKKREYDLNIKLKEQRQWENDNKNLRAYIQSKTKEIEEWRTRASRLEEEALRGKEMVHYNNELTDKLELASKELERLNNLLRVKLDEIQKWKQRCSAKEAEISQLKNLENDVAQYESKISMIKTENDRINGILKARLEEIQTWKKKNAELENGLSKMAFMEKDKKMLEDKFNNQLKNFEELKFTLGRLENDNNALRKYEQRCRDIQGKNEAICKQMERMNQIIRSKDQQLNDNRVKFNKLDSTINEYKNIQIYLKDNENKIALMTQEIDRLNNLIKTKNEDIEQLEKEKIEIHSAMTKYKNYEIKIYENEQTVAKLQNNIEICKKDIENWQNKFRASEARGKELENNLYSTSQEKEKVGNIARTKTQQCEELKNKINFLQNQIKKYGELQVLCEQLHKQSMINLSDLEAMERKAKDFEAQYNKERSNAQELRSKLNSAASELERLTVQSRNVDGRKTKQFAELQEHYSKLLTRVKSKDNEIEILTSKIAQLEAQCANLMKEFNRLLDTVEQSFKESLTLSQKIEEYQDYARRIHILGSELDRLTQLNKGLEEDNKVMRLKYSNSINIEKREQEFNLVTVLMAAEIESLRKRIEERETTVDEMRKSILDPIRRV